MARTRHMQARMNQRAIDQELVSLTTDWGASQLLNGVEKQVLDRTGIDHVLRRLDRFRGTLLKARDKGGIVLVSGEEGVDITAYRHDSYRRPRTRQ